MECIWVHVRGVFYNGGIKSLKIWGRERRCIYAHTQMAKRSWERGSHSCFWMGGSPQQDYFRLVKSAVSMLRYVRWYLQRPKYSRWGRDPHYADAPFSRCPRVRVRCPRLRSTLTLSGQVQSAAGLAALFTGKEVQGKAGIGAGGEVTGELVSGNRHHAYSVDSGQTLPRDNCHPALARGQCSPDKSLHTS